MNALRVGVVRVVAAVDVAVVSIARFVVCAVADVALVVDVYSVAWASIGAVVSLLLLWLRLCFLSLFGEQLLLQALFCVVVAGVIIAFVVSVAAAAGVFAVVVVVVVVVLLLVLLMILLSADNVH